LETLQFYDELEDVECDVALWGREEEHTGFWWVNMKEKDQLEDLGEITLKRIFMNRDWGGGRHGLD
jgi:hypothetical protein